MSPHAALPGDAVRALAFMFGYAGGWIEVRCDAGPEPASFWHPCGHWRDGLERLAGVIRSRDERFSEEITLSLPRRRRGLQFVDRATVLWAVVEGKAQAAALERFKPVPSLVLREGGSSRRTAVWMLNRAVPHEAVVRANRRIAHRLGAAKKHADPDELRLPAPGTCLRVGRSRPVPVVVERLEPVWWTVREVVGHLRDAPDADAWRQRAVAR